MNSLTVEYIFVYMCTLIMCAAAFFFFFKIIFLCKRSVTYYLLFSLAQIGGVELFDA